MWEGISGLITLIVLILKMFIDMQTSKTIKITSEDEKIDAVSTADDTIIELDRLQQPLANRS